MTCILCAHKSTHFFTDPISQFFYFHCKNCDLRFLDPERRLDSKHEYERYKLHQNHIEDINYQNFVRPMAEWVIARCPAKASGLDFGCGKGSVLAHILEEFDFKISLFDPFFFNRPESLEKNYDFIVATEVAEHFYSPKIEFSKLKNIMSPNAGLGIMTSLYNESMDFGSWYYRRDPTHICFYSTKTFSWLQSELKFTSYENDGCRLNWLKN